MEVVPVTLPPGRARLSINPAPTGFPASTITMGIVAVARKLLMALWRFLETGVVPDGAVFKEGEALG